MKIGKSPLIAIGLALVAGGWIASGQIGNGANGAEQATAPAAEKTETPRASVRVADLVALPRMEMVSITGRTEASRTVELRAETEGQVIEILAQRGDPVNKDDVIARLRMDDRGAKLSEAKAVLTQRKIEYEAARKLHDKGFRSTTEQAAAQARLDAARAVVEQMEIEIARITLLAPFEGIIGAGHVELGDFVRIGDVAATIVDLDPVLAVGSVSERQIGGLRKGGERKQNQNTEVFCHSRAFDWEFVMAKRYDTMTDARGLSGVFNPPSFLLFFVTRPCLSKQSPSCAQSRRRQEATDERTSDR